MDHKNSMVFKSIQTKEDAFKMINEAGILFFIVSIVQVLFSVLLDNKFLWIDAGLYLVFAFILKQFKSKIAAVALCLLAALGFISSVLMKVGLIEIGGTNVILSALILWVAIRTVDGAFKYHKFK